MLKLTVCGILALWACGLGAGAMSSAVTEQTQARTIPRMLGVSIAERLLPGDEVVRVVPAVPPGAVLPFAPLTWDETITRFSRTQAIVLVERPLVEGRLTHDGSWVRSHVVAPIVQVVVAGDLPIGDGAGTLEFTFDGGDTMVSGVHVIAGDYPLLRVEKRYLLFLHAPRGGRTYALSVAMEVDAAGRLAMVYLLDGGPLDFPSDVYGQPVDKLIRALMQR